MPKHRSPRVVSRHSYKATLAQVRPVVFRTVHLAPLLLDVAGALQRSHAKLAILRGNSLGNALLGSIPNVRCAIAARVRIA